MKKKRRKAIVRYVRRGLVTVVLILCAACGMSRILCKEGSSSFARNEVFVKIPEERVPQMEEETDWNLLLVNPWNKMPEDFSVELTKLKNGQSIDERAYPELQEMMDDARALGLKPLICSSYRTNEKQQMLYDNKVREYLRKGYSEKRAKEEAGKWVAVPGTSEHETGLAVDIVAESYQILDEKQEETAEQQWLMENSWKYGFILRYPERKSEVTGIHYEPWHYRYVGKEAAKEMYEAGMCLEEYLEGISDKSSLEKNFLAYNNLINSIKTNNKT